MTTAQRKRSRMTFDEYVAFEDAATVRHELIDGMLFAMPGGSDGQELIAGNLFVAIRGPLLGKCQVFQAGMKLKVEMRRRTSWAVEELFAGDTLALESVGVDVALDDIYETITF